MTDSITTKTGSVQDWELQLRAAIARAEAAEAKLTDSCAAAFALRKGLLDIWTVLRDAASDPPRLVAERGRLMQVAHEALGRNAGAALLARLEAERDRYLESLMDVVNQSCQVDYRDGQCAVHHGCISAYEDAIGLLVTEGYALLAPDGNWVLRWPTTLGVPGGKDRAARALEARE